MEMVGICFGPVFVVFRWKGKGSCGGPEGVHLWASTCFVCFLLSVFVWA